LIATNYFVVSEPELMSQVDEILSTVVAEKTPPAWLPPMELGGWSDCGRFAAPELP
jgi:hypothetical protein